MQLVAYGAQDVYLTGNPQITFWKVTYKRHTNFSMESIEQVFNGCCDFGGFMESTIARNGDLMYRTYLVVTLPEINCCWEPGDGGAPTAGRQDANWARWLDYPGENIIEYIDLDIGGQRIDRQYGEWMHIWNQLSLTSDKREGYLKMIGHTTELTYLTMGQGYEDEPCEIGPCNTCAYKCNLPETTLFIPLQFWYCNNPGLALPLIALQYHEVKIKVQLKNLDCVLWAVDSLSDGSGNAGLGDGHCGYSQKAQGASGRGAYDKSLVTCSLYVDYVFLDRDERRFMAQKPHEYLIEQVQMNCSQSASMLCNKVSLEFNHPCKEIFFTAQQEYFLDCCKQFESCQPLYKALGAQPFNYTDCLDAMPRAHQAFRGNNQESSPYSYGQRNFYNGLFRNPGAMSETMTGGGQVYDNLIYAGRWQELLGVQKSWAPLSAEFNSLVSDAGSIVLGETAHGMHCWGRNPFVKVDLRFNGIERFSARTGKWFNLVQPFQHHTAVPDTGINVYSFALRPEEHQPSGTCNFSRLDSVTLNVALTNKMFNDWNNTTIIKAWATNYNVLRVMSGMGGLAYSN